MSAFCIAIHGGAGTILKSSMTPEKENSYRQALKLAIKINIEFEDDNYFFNQLRYDQLMEIKGYDKTILDHSDKKFGTIGAVALDKNGNLAAATSTGGMTNKRFGRIGDTPIIGAGT